jgi:hypothetical protein
MRALGTRSANPWSLGFARAVARWQRRVGLPATGVLASREWLMLMRRGPISYWPTPPVPPEPFPVAAPMLGGAPEPPDAAQVGFPESPEAPGPMHNDDGVDPSAAPAPEGMPAGNGDTAAGEWYELARWATP